ncbi:MAG: hypothetical protein QE487_17155 [Fluviicola sp.]|nr:hypothetical protein [Fluviicola sp.]
MKKTTVKTAITLGMGLLIYTCTSISAGTNFSKSFSGFEKGKIKYIESAIDSLEFAMKVPDYMETTASLDNSRPFQYMNEVKEHYIMASYELISDVIPAMESMGYSGDNLLDEYVTYNQEVIAEGVNVSAQKPVKKLTIDGMPARMLQFDGMVDGIDEGISYFAVFIESKNKLYFVLAWTLESKKSEFTPIAGTMLKSFHLKKN